METLIKNFTKFTWVLTMFQNVGSLAEEKGIAYRSLTGKDMERVWRPHLALEFLWFMT